MLTIHPKPGGHQQILTGWQSPLRKETLRPGGTGCTLISCTLAALIPGLILSLNSEPVEQRGRLRSLLLLPVQSPLSYFSAEANFPTLP